MCFLDGWWHTVERKKWNIYGSSNMSLICETVKPRNIYIWFHGIERVERGVSSRARNACLTLRCFTEQTWGDMCISYRCPTSNPRRLGHQQKWDMSPFFSWVSHGKISCQPPVTQKMGIKVRKSHNGDRQARGFICSKLGNQSEYHPRIGNWW